MEFRIINPDELTETQLLEVIGDNCKTASLMQKEIDQLKEVAAKTGATKKAVVVIPKSSHPKTEKISNKDEDFEDEVNYYFSAFNKLSIDDLEENFESILPSRKNYRYKEILYRLKAGIIKNIKEIKDCIGEENLTLEEANEFKSYIELEQAKLRLITDKINEKSMASENAEEETENNRLVFTLTNSGNARVLEELDHIAPEYYDRFYTLFQSIKDGTLKNIKRITNNGNVIGISEVKTYGVRVLLDRLDKNTYAVISAFVKKTDSDNYYLTQLKAKVSDYYSQQDSLKANLSNEEFIAEQALFEQELFNRVKPSSLQSSPQYVKKGDE